jgi:LysM repeat protein
MTKHQFILLLLLLVQTVCAAKDYPLTDYLNPNNNDRKKYIERFRRIAIAEMERTGIPASIKLAQGILESNDGKSDLAVKANNHFGIKCGNSWTGGTMFKKDDDRDVNGNLVESCFRVYQTPEESFRDHSDFLTDPKKKYRYGPLFMLSVTDYKAWAKGLQSSGYATNKSYADLLIGIIEANNLNEYDFMEALDIDPQVAQNDYRYGVRYNNDVKMVFTREGERLAEIASRYNLKTNNLLKYNELNDVDAVFKEGQRVYLQRKRKSFRGKKAYHIVKDTDDMHAIAQLYGLRLGKLYDKNRMLPGSQPAVGQRISLTSRVPKGEAPRLRSLNEKAVPFIPALEIFVTGILADNAPPINLPEGNNTAPTVEQQFHTVAKGDTLFAIAKKYGITVEAIKKLNNLLNNDISIGQKLRVQ